MARASSRQETILSWTLTETIFYPALLISRALNSPMPQFVQNTSLDAVLTNILTVIPVDGKYPTLGGVSKVTGIGETVCEPAHIGHLTSGTFTGLIGWLIGRDPRLWDTCSQVGTLLSTFADRASVIIGDMFSQHADWWMTVMFRTKAVNAVMLIHSTFTQIVKGWGLVETKSQIFRQRF
jgi:hypothetical protein